VFFAPSAAECRLALVAEELPSHRRYKSYPRSQMLQKDNSKAYMIAVVAGGTLCLATALLNLSLEAIDLNFLFLFCLTIFVGSRLSLKIPKFKSHISVSDIFIFFTLLTYGGELAIVLAAAEAFFSSRRFCNKTLTILFNSSSVALSTALAYGVLFASGLASDGHSHGETGFYERLIVVLSVVAVVQFVSNTTLAAIYDGLQGGAPTWEVWKSKYAWSFVTYLAGSFSAGALHLLSDLIGFSVIIASFPVIFFLYTAYRMYLKNVEMSLWQAEQAEQYAKILEEQSEALRESEERFRSAFNFAPIGIALVSAAGTWLKVNHALCDILGYTEKEFLERDFQSVIFPEDLGATLVRIHDLLAGKVPNCQMEQRYIHRSGRTVWASWSASPAGDARSSLPNLIFQIQDITDKKQAEENLHHEATHDGLTGLPNRKMFMSRLGQALESAKQSPAHRVSVLFIDLDRFKYVNDSLGHLIGDQLLIGIAGRLRECMRPSDIVARLGGDEFTILVEGSVDESEVIGIAERVQEKFSQPFDLDGHEVFSSASIGILHAGDQHLTPEDMMRDADTAMYQAKRAGKARHEIFDEKMHLAAKETLRIETDLRRAIDNGEIFMMYQPMFSLSTHRIQGIEALTRWQHPTLGSIAPSKFIGIAEEIGLIDTLGQYILEQTCSEAGPLLNGFISDHPLTLSVNLSCRQFGQKNLVGNVKRVLEETGFAAEQLKLEITESIFFEYQAKAIEMLHEIRALGVEIDIDDFGTGYSNLGYLIRLPISTLKIDRSFVEPIDAGGNNTEIVRTVLALARNLGLKTVAEGIETEHQLKALRDLGCDGGQGYYFARPMRLAELDKYLNELKNSEGYYVPYDDVPVLATLQ
jgi:diguanylate cyclase (GGDEF)-like protein/PAS domain S-box-containing protein